MVILLDAVLQQMYQTPFDETLICMYS